MINPHVYVLDGNACATLYHWRVVYPELKSVDDLLKALRRRKYTAKCDYTTKPDGRFNEFVFTITGLTTDAEREKALIVLRETAIKTGWR